MLDKHEFEITPNPETTKMLQDIRALTMAERFIILQNSAHDILVDLDKDGLMASNADDPNVSCPICMVIGHGKRAIELFNEYND